MSIDTKQILFSIAVFSTAIAIFAKYLYERKYWHKVKGYVASKENRGIGDTPYILFKIDYVYRDSQCTAFLSQTDLKSLRVGQIIDLLVSAKKPGLVKQDAIAVGLFAPLMALTVTASGIAYFLHWIR